MIAVVDYGVGNLFSLCSSLRHIGAECRLAGTAEELEEVESIILPGVGAFGDAVEKLRAKNLEQPILDAVKKGKPLLGICLGMQLLFDTSGEYGAHRGLGLIKGEIKSLAAELGDTNEYKVPHIGWNNLIMRQDCQILENHSDGGCVYYVHSYYAPVGDYTAAYSQYGPVRISGAVRHENVFGTQFHPEKSGVVGLEILRSFAKLK